MALIAFIACEDNSAFYGNLLLSFFYGTTNQAMSLYNGQIVH